MEAYSNPGLRLKFHIHLAASTILIENIYTKFATAIRLALALYFGNLPANITVAKYPALILCQVLLGASLLGLACQFRPNRKFPCTPAELAISGSLWIAIASTLHGSNLAFSSPDLNRLVGAISSSPIYICLFYGCMILTPLNFWRLFHSGIYKHFRGFDFWIRSARILAFQQLFIILRTFLERNRCQLLRSCTVILTRFIGFVGGRLLIRPILRPWLHTTYMSWNVFLLQSCFCIIPFVAVDIQGLNFANPFEIADKKPNVPWPRHHPQIRIRVIESAKTISREPDVSFRYSPLQSPRHIRLLILHRRLPSEPVSCSLVHFSLDHAPRYEALSYTWGNSNKARRIWVNGHSFEVTESAYEILRTRSSFWASRLLWIDSICINQTSNDEKTHQIGLMRDIYRSSFTVTVHLSLGEGPEDLLRQAYASFDAAEIKYVVESMNFNKEMLDQIDTKFDSNMFSVWATLIVLLKHPWFERVWVIQEVALATSIRLMYCGIEISWQHFADAIIAISQHFSLAAMLESTEKFQIMQLDLSGLVNAATMIELRDRVRTGQSLSFSSVMFESYKFKATDPRDRVFGIQGICSIHDQSLLPDYSKSLQQVYIDAARYFLTQEEPLRLLCFAGVGYSALQDEQKNVLGNLPSWVPDWSRTPVLTPFSYRYPKHNYCAGGNTLPDVQMKPLKDSMALTLRGLCVDVIEKLGPIFSLTMDEVGRSQVMKLAEINRCHRASWHLAQHSTRTKDPYRHKKPSQSLYEAYWRTLIGDRTPLHCPAPAWYAKSFEDWQASLGELSSVSTCGKPLDGATISVTYPKSEMLFITSSFGRVAPLSFSGRRFCTTRRGYIGFVPPGTQQGDMVSIFLGTQTPFIIRPSSRFVYASHETISKGFYRLIGEAYMHGMMDGEMIAGNLSTKMFEIV
jgi:hypothetical protein